MCRLDTMRALHQALLHTNPYPAAYRSMWERLEEEERTARAMGQEPPEVALRFVQAVDADMRRYNAPSSSEVAAVFVGDDGAPPSNRARS